MQRRAFLLQCATTVLAAQQPGSVRQEFTNWLGQWAGNLSADNPSSFIRAVDPQMPGRNLLASHVAALLRGWVVSSSVQIQSFDEELGEALLDWSVHLAPKTPPGVSERRRELLRLKTVRHKKRWRVVQLEPVDFFRPPALDGNGSSGRSSQ